MSRGKLQHLVKWKGYRHEHNVWYNDDDLENAQDLITEYESRSHAKLRRKPRQQGQEQPIGLDAEDFLPCGCEYQVGSML